MYIIFRDALECTCGTLRQLFQVPNDNKTSLDPVFFAFPVKSLGNVAP